MADENKIALAVERLKQELAEVEQGIREAWDDIKAGKVFAAVLLLREIVEGIVLAIEEVAESIGGMTGEEKKRAATQYLNSIIDIPAVPEIVEGWAIGFVIDFVVAKLNANDLWTIGLEGAKKLLANIKLVIHPHE